MIAQAQFVHHRRTEGLGVAQSYTAASVPDSEPANPGTLAPPWPVGYGLFRVVVVDQIVVARNQAPAFAAGVDANTAFIVAQDLPIRPPVAERSRAYIRSRNILQQVRRGGRPRPLRNHGIRKNAFRTAGAPRLVVRLVDRNAITEFAAQQAGERIRGRCTFPMRRKTAAIMPTMRLPVRLASVGTGIKPVSTPWLCRVP